MLLPAHSEALQLTDEQHNFHTIVAGGGDGTLNEVVAAMLKYNAPAELSVAQLPLGTANDLASAAGISLVSNHLTPSEIASYVHSQQLRCALTLLWHMLYG